MYSFFVCSHEEVERELEISRGGRSSSEDLLSAPAHARPAFCGTSVECVRMVGRDLRAADAAARQASAAAAAAAPAAAAEEPASGLQREHKEKGACSTLAGCRVHAANVLGSVHL